MIFGLPWKTKYPYTDLEQINLDWLMSIVGGFDARITKNENDIKQLRTDLTTEIADRIAGDNLLDSKLAQEAQTRANADDALNTRITSISGRIANVESDIDAIKEDISELDDKIPTITANPGGSGTNLNTIDINGTTYTVAGSGGGSGSSITPNPAGSPTANLTKLDIDGTIYGIASGGSSVIANPSGISSGDLNKIEIDGSIYTIPQGQQIAIDSTLNSNSNNAIANAPVANAFDRIDQSISGINSNLANINSILNQSIISGSVQIDSGSFNQNVDSPAITLPAGTWILIINSRTILSGINAYANITSSSNISVNGNTVQPLPISRIQLTGNVSSYEPFITASFSKILTLTSSSTIRIVKRVDSFSGNTTTGFLEDIYYQAIRVK